MPEDDRKIGGCRSLKAIADILGVPVASFFVADAEVATDRSAGDQEAELLTLFRQITDGDRRAQCLAFLRAVAGKGQGR